MVEIGKTIEEFERLTAKYVEASAAYRNLSPQISPEASPEASEAQHSLERLNSFVCFEAPSIFAQLTEATARVGRLEDALRWYGDEGNWVRDCWVDADASAEIPSTRIRFNEYHEVALLSRSTGINMINRQIKYTGFGPAMDFGQRARDVLKVDLK